MTNVAYIDARCNAGLCERKSHYVVMGRCANCAWEGYLWITNGHPKSDVRRRAVCPRCECKEIQPGEFVEGNGAVAA